ncbi:MAG: NAD(P) transhydrogenase subunit alpha [Candidatus Neomarinimicrobiota bacterium]|nr:NAD(P) transhydrogenase subunit alpha [Candidatus Neomarinimicrobiota bacterium]|tara:strand:- start:172 stop:453 length:282 start_codon:yes stop_codon:yes gene_type:complete
MEQVIGLIFIAVLATFAGAELIGKVPPQLHTPLMSGSNAISGITIVGALLALGESGNDKLLSILGFCAIIFATINVVGGYLVTDRMLKMFRKK